MGKATEWLAAQRGRPVGLSKILPPETRSGQLKPLLPAKPEPKAVTLADLERRAQQQAGWTDEELQFYAGRSHTPPADSQYTWDLWSPGKFKNSFKNMFHHADKHADEFGLSSGSTYYTQQTHDFIEKPPSGAELLLLNNGQRVYYHEPSNTFVVTLPNKTPQSRYTPDEFRAWFEKQFPNGEYKGFIGK